MDEARPGSREGARSPAGRAANRAATVDALRLAVGTMTAFPVPAPAGIAPPVPGRAMALAPPAGILPGLAGWLVAFAAMRLGLASLVASVLVVAAFALSTRALHLDGLADTADGFTASYDRDKALDVMRRGDSGPAGVAMVVIVLMLQVTALNQVLVTGRNSAAEGWLGDLAVTSAVVTVAVTARIAVPLICRSGIPPARPEGLGALVAGSVGNVLLAASLVVTVLIAALTGWAAGLPWWGGPAAVATVAVTTHLLVRRATVRLGGITGDIIGAGVEIGTAAALLALAASA